MSEVHQTIPTVDGLWAKHPDGDGLTVSWSLNNLPTELIARLDDKKPSEVGVILLGRSATTYAAGLSLEESDKPVVVDKNRLYAPHNIAVYHPVGDKVMEEVNRLMVSTKPGDLLSHNDERLAGGRMIDRADNIQLTADEVEEAIAEKRIGLAKPSVDYSGPLYIKDGSDIRVPLAPWQLSPVSEVLLKNGAWFDLIVHGRNKAWQNMIEIPRNPEHRLGRFTTATVLVSPGEFNCEVVEKVSPDGKIWQIPGGRWIDKDRTMGLREELGPKRRGQQVELVNDGSDLPWSEVWPALRFYRPNPATRKGAFAINFPLVNWKDMTPDERNSIHQNGFDFADVIEPMLPALEPLTQEPYGGAVITPKGITRVPHASTQYEGELTAETAQEHSFICLINGAQSAGRNRAIPEDLEHLDGLLKKMGLIANNPRLGLARNLSPTRIIDLFNEGSLEAITVWQDGEIVTDKGQHSALVEAVRNGKSVFWVNDGRFLTLHRSGFRGSPEDIKRFSQLDWVYSGYGSNYDKEGEKQRQAITDYFATILQAGIDPHALGIAQGHGPGVMRVHHEVALDLRLLSIASAMDFSSLGQGRQAGQRPQPSLIEIIMAQLDRLPRQGLLDDSTDIANFWSGGSGTINEELGIRLTSTKLGNFLPMPMNLIEGTGLYKNMILQLEELAERGLLSDYVPRLVNNFTSAKSAAEHTLKFMERPDDLWHDIKIKPDILKKAFINHEIRNRRMGRKTAQPLIDAAHRFAF